MSMRISDRAASLALLLALGGCGQAASDPFGGADAEKVECRIAPATAFDRTCVIERTSGSDGLVLTVRHPDGGFRRLLVTKDGRGVIAADGAEPATVALQGDKGILVTIGEDGYRLPATIKPAAAH